MSAGRTWQTSSTGSCTLSRWTGFSRKTSRAFGHSSGGDKVVRVEMDYVDGEYTVKVDGEVAAVGTDARPTFETALPAIAGPLLESQGLELIRSRDGSDWGAIT